MRPEFPNFNVFILTLPRCHSSVSVRILEQLGVNMVYDTEDPLKAANRIIKHRGKFGDFEMNERFGEIGNNWDECVNNILETPYSGCKLLLPNHLEGRGWKLMTQQPSKVLLMWRDVEDIRDSQDACYIRPRAPYSVPEDPNEQIEVEKAYFTGQLFNAKLQLENRKELAGRVRFKGNEDKVAPFDYMIVSTNNLYEYPENTIDKIARFIESPFRIWNAVEEFDPSKVRFRKNRRAGNILNHNEDPRNMRDIVIIELPNDDDIEEGEQHRERAMHLKQAQLQLEQLKIQCARTEEDMLKVIKAISDKEENQKEITILGKNADEITMHVDQAEKQIEAYEARIEFLVERIKVFKKAINKKLEE